MLEHFGKIWELLCTKYIVKLFFLGYVLVHEVGVKIQLWSLKFQKGNNFVPLWGWFDFGTLLSPKK